jgi:3-deoxy-manno-octulosonate cytidylyltransferase (CMP-KDO synthetase)
LTLKIAGIIPARYQSSRFPGKALIQINGKSMIQRVFEQSSKAKSLDSVIVATDDQRILDHVTGFGGAAVMTSTECRNGTERCREVIARMDQKFDFIINIQGDEPFISPDQIDQVATLFGPDIQIATLAKKIDTSENLFNTNVNKVIFTEDRFAIYFSRAPVPFLRNFDKESWVEHYQYYKHIGIYGYSVPVLNEIVNLQPSPLEIAESLEQLRWIENGYSIKVGITDIDSQGIDTPDDLERILKKIK